MCRASVPCLEWAAIPTGPPKPFKPNPPPPQPLYIPRPPSPLPQASRPTVTVHTYKDGEVKATSSLPLPAVFTAPIRHDVVQFVHTNIRKNSRQAYAVAYASGEQTSAMSWGTGRAVARIPRVAGGGTGRSGQGAFGNMCRKGRMYAPTKIWRRWHRHVNVGQRRFAIVSALAASALAPLVEARGHRVSGVEEVPLVISAPEGIKKTSEAVKLLKAVRIPLPPPLTVSHPLLVPCHPLTLLSPPPHPHPHPPPTPTPLLQLGAYEDVERVSASKKLRAGAGKGRNRRFVQRRGPLVVYADEGEQFPRAFRNIPGCDHAHVDRLNLLQLAPGGHLGRFIVWTSSAFARLEALFGAVGSPAPLKNGFTLPRAPVANGDLARLINSTEIQSVVRPALRGQTCLARQKKNPLVNFRAMVKLNPYAKVIRETELAAQAARAAGKGPKKAKVPAAQRAASRKQSKAIYKSMIAEEFVQ
jgi:large subunit ribosomal protein L4e